MSRRAPRSRASTTVATIDVVVPTYRRPTDLFRCLGALRAQTVAPAQIIVVVRDGDLATENALASFREAVRVTHVAEPGMVAALNRGLNAVAADAVAITDDDAAPRPDWLARIIEHFRSSPDIGGVGGRDWVWEDGRVIGVPTAEVGRLRWTGRLVGNHHLGTGPTRDVDFLKGVNMAYRREAIGDSRFDTRLRGQGAQVHNDLSFSLAVRARGWRLVYDPQVAVDHYPGVRHDADQRSGPADSAVFDAVANETQVLLEHLPSLRRVVFLARAALIGTRLAPGLAVAVATTLTSQRGPALRTVARARVQGWRSARGSRPPAPVEARLGP